MIANRPEWADALVDVLALAARLEDEGQYNIAKLLRAAADALGRRAAYQRGAPAEPGRLPAELRRAAAQLSALDIGPELPTALERGAAALDQGRVPLIDETPHPFVCRTCGQVAVGEVTDLCPTCGVWPDTFQRFMPTYWFDALEPFAVLQTLRRTPEEVAALLAGLSEEAMSRPPLTGGWAIRNVVTHLRDAQHVLAGRVDLFLGPLVAQRPASGVRPGDAAPAGQLLCRARAHSSAPVGAAARGLA